MTDRIDFEQVREVVRIATESDVTELEVETPSLKVKVRRAAPAEEQGAHATREAALGVVAAADRATVTTAPTTSDGATAPAPTPDNDHMRPIVAPMVGTFYRASSPDAVPYIKVGDAVGEGQVVCVIEAMKLFNEIQAEVSGRIARVLVENATPVEYGQPLFVVDTTPRS
jgi:acetyl-CoA carboxylase biotin carboxyl carrier protein